MDAAKHLRNTRTLNGLLTPSIALSLSRTQSIPMVALDLDDKNAT